MKKYTKLFTFAFFTFFISLVSVFAKEMTIEELGEEASKINPKVNYVYILGKYAFTSEFDIKQEDIILASTSVNPTNPTNPDDMVIYHISREYDDSFNPTGWKEDKNPLGNAKIPEKLDICYIDYNILTEKSEAKVNFDIFAKNDYKEYTDILKEKLKFEATDSYDGGKLIYANGKLSGLLLKNKNIVLNDEEKEKYENTPYFFAYVLEVPNASEKTKVTTSGMNISGELKWAKFDVQDSEKSGFVVLVPVVKSKWEKDKSYSITIDLDGDTSEDGKTGAGYEPVTYTLDLSGLSFQEDSMATLSDDENDISNSDKELLRDWGYNLFGENKNYNLTSEEENENFYKLTGKVEEQHLKEKTFSSNAENGYFFVFNLKKANGMTEVPEDVKITVVGQNQFTYGKKSFNENGIFTEIFKLNENCSNDSCKVTIKVDWDGDGNEYLPTIYTIDYSSLIFEKSSLFEVQALEKDSDNEFNDDGWLDKDGYFVKVEKDVENPDKYYVSGVLPIFDDSEWKEGNDPLDSKENDYYLGLKLKLINAPKDFDNNNNKMTIKFFDSEGVDNNYKVVTGKDFIYILKYLVPSETKKEFRIIVDLDGENEGEYAPYTVTINYDGLKFQNNSLGDFNYEILKNSSNVEDLVTWKFNDETIAEVNIQSNNTLEGKIKEQTLDSSAGFTNNTGYFVPIKIFFPTDPKFQEYKKSWTITLYDENGVKKVPYEISNEEYEQGWVLVLFRLDTNKTGEDAKIKYEIDFDGDESAFLPKEYTISYDGLTYCEAVQLNFEGVKNVDSVTIWEGDTITKDKLPQKNPVADDEYHEFVYWNNLDGTKAEGIVVGKEDITLVPHWNLYSDKFVTDVVDDLNKKGNFNNKFVIEKLGENSGTFMIIVKDSETPLSIMNDTSIPGAIAYILLKDEIQSITLEVNGQTKEFTKKLGDNQSTLKVAIQQGIKELYSTILAESFEGKDDTEVTLSELAHKKGLESFTLKFDENKISKTVTLAEQSVEDTSKVPTEYKFTFNSDIVIVKSEAALKEAIENNEKNISIGANFTVNSTIDITNSVNINGIDRYTITASDDSKPIFNVKNSNVIIDNVTLKGAKIPIIVSSGSLTATKISVTDEKAETVIEVKEGATLTASELEFTNEHYNRPAVKAEKTSTVNLKDDKSHKASVITEKEKITKYEDQPEDAKSNLGDNRERDTEYNYNNYYIKEENSKIYQTTFHNYQGSKKATFYRYNYYGETVDLPFSEKPFDVFKKFEYDGFEYIRIGFTENRDKIVVFDQSSEDLSEIILDSQDIKATSDKMYYGSYEAKQKDYLVKVKNAAKLKEALDNPNIKEILIDTTDLIDLTNYGTITINRNLSIVGKTTISNLKVKDIVIEETAKDVFIHRVNIQADPEAGKTTLIDVKGEEFTLWQSSLKNISENKVESAIKYSGNKAIVDIRWNKFYANNIDNTFIDIATKLAGVSDIYYNTFEALTKDDKKKSAITIKEFDSSAQISDDGDETISIDLNTFNEKDYAIEISESASSQKADIMVESSKKLNIAVKYYEINNQFGNINIHLKGKTDFNNIKLYYISNSGDESEILPEGDGVKIVPIGSVPESINITGLSMNENDNSYSGILANQSSDGKFYLPVILTSNDFVENVSTVKVTAPDGSQPVVYTYGTNTNLVKKIDENTMSLQLEAVKTSKLSSSSKKVYELELDPDGFNSNEKEVKKYTLDYSGVNTLEEIINKAAEKTLNVKSLTVRKNNKINGYSEYFDYKFNEETGLTYYKSISTSRPEEEYTFSLKYVGLSDSKKSAVVYKKNDTDREGSVYLNDWRFAFTLKVGKPIHELLMLTDVMNGTTNIEAIEKVVKTDIHTYEVLLSKQKYNDWIDKTYLSEHYYDGDNYTASESYKEGNNGVTSVEKEDRIKVRVTLDDTDTYISKIETINENNNTKSNIFNVEFSDFNRTQIAEPKKFLSKDGTSEIDDDTLKKFYDDGITAWKKYSGASE